MFISYVVKGIKIKITAKFRASRCLRFKDTKRIMSPEMRPKSFRTFEKQAPGALTLKGLKKLILLSVLFLNFSSSTGNMLMFGVAL